MARTGLEDAIQGQSVDIGLAVTEVRVCVFVCEGREGGECVCACEGEGGQEGGERREGGEWGEWGGR